MKISTLSAVAFCFIFAFALIPDNLYSQEIKLTAQETMWVDANKCGVTGPQGAWMSFVIKNNTPATLSNVTVTFAGFSGTYGSYYIPPSDPVRNFSSIGVNDSVGVFYYVDYS